MAENVWYKEQLLAIIVRKEYSVDGIEFLTKQDFSQQVACMHHPKGKVIDAHVHNIEARNVVYTQEVLIVRKGKLRVDFYNDDRMYVESRLLIAGDIILLVSGGHGFEVLDEVDMVEIKQGPYLGEKDKIRFKGVSVKDVRIVGEEKDV